MDDKPTNRVEDSGSDDEDDDILEAEPTKILVLSLPPILQSTPKDTVFTIEQDAGRELTAAEKSDHARADLK